MTTFTFAYSDLELELFSALLRTHILMTYILKAPKPERVRDAPPFPTMSKHRTAIMGESRHRSFSWDELISWNGMRDADDFDHGDLRA